MGGDGGWRAVESSGIFFFFLGGGGGVVTLLLPCHIPFPSVSSGSGLEPYSFSGFLSREL